MLFPVRETLKLPGESVAANSEGKCGTARSAIRWMILQELSREVSKRGFTALPPEALSTPSDSEPLSLRLENNKLYFVLDASYTPNT